MAFFEPVKEWIAHLYDLVPDFFKNGFNGSKIQLSETALKVPNNAQAFIPSRVNNFSQAQQSNHQSVNVAVNVKSGSAPQDIGSEVAKAIRKEMQREREIAFMGVTQYAT